MKNNKTKILKENKSYNHSPDDAEFSMQENIYEAKYIPAILQQLGFPPSKKWGQNFLVNHNIHQKIAESAQIQTSEMVIEIGPGLGHLTEQLLHITPNVLAVEIDPRFINFLKKRFQNFSGFQIINCDALDGKHNLHPCLIESIAKKSEQTPYKVIANLPYNIAAPIIINFLELPTPPNQMVVMIQKEVANRIMAQPNTPEYGPLSLFVQLHGNIRQIMTVPPQAFYPPPKVYSSVIQITYSPKKVEVDDRNMLKATIFTLFNLRRKTISNALKQSQFIEFQDISILEASLKKSGIEGKQRAESLTLSEFVQLANSLYSFGVKAKTNESQLF